MKMVFVNAEMFDDLMQKIGAEISGQDVGRTHGQYWYSRHHGTRQVGHSSFVRNGNDVSWLYQVASYLYEAYCK